MHEDGENDSRSTYCAIHVASLTNVLTEDLAAGVVDFLVRGCRKGVMRAKEFLYDIYLLLTKTRTCKLSRL